MSTPAARKGANWARFDDYGLEHLAEHLYAARSDGEFRTALYALVDRSFLHVKRARFGSPRTFAADVLLAIEAARSETPVNLIQETRGCLVHATLGALARRLPPTAFDVLVRSGRLPQALSWAELVREPARRCDVYRTIGEALDFRGQPEPARSAALEALAALASLPTPDQEGVDNDRAARLVSSVVPLLAAVGEQEAALTTVTRMERETVHPPTRRWLAEALVLLDRPDQALKLATGIDAEDIRVAALCGIARNLFAAKQRQRAMVIVNQAWDAADRIRDPVGAAGALTTVAHTFASAGRRNQAADVLVRALRPIEAIERPYERKRAMVTFASDLARLRESRAALEATQRFSDERDRVEALAEVAIGLAEAGLAARAGELAEEVVSRARALGDHPDRILACAAAVLARVGQIDRSLTLAEEVADPMERSQLLVSIATAAMDGGAPSLAVELGERALSLLDAVSKRDWEATFTAEVRHRVFGDLQEELAQFGTDVERWPPEFLVAVAKRMSTATESLQDESSRANRLAEIAHLMLRVGQVDRAAQVASRALEIAEEVVDRGERDNALARIGVALAQAGAVQRARTVAARVTDAESRARVTRALKVRPGSRDRSARTLGGDATDAPPARKKAPAPESGQPESVAAVLSRISETSPVADRARQLGELAQKLADQDQDDAARAVAERALAELGSAGYTDQMARAAARLAHALARLGDLEGALSLARSILPDADRTQALGAIACAGGATLAQADAHALASEALELAKLIPDPAKQAPALDQAVRALASHGGLRRALAAVKSVSDTHWQGVALTAIVDQCVRTGHVKQALRVTDEMYRTEARAEALLGMVDVLARRGEVNRLQPLLGEFDSRYGRSGALLAAVRGLVAAGSLEPAARLARDFDDDNRESEALCIIARGLAAAGKLDRAARLAGRALSCARELRDQDSLSVALARVAWAFALAGRKQDASSSVREAMAALRRFKWDVDEVNTLAYSSRALAASGHVKRSAALAVQAFAGTTTITYPELRSAPLRRAAGAVIATGVLDTALAQVARSDDEYWRSDAARALALAAAKSSGDLGSVQHVLTSLDDSADRIDVLAEAAGALIEAGNASAARQLTGAALAQLETATYAGWQADVAGKAARALAEAGSADQALALLARIDDPYWLPEAVLDVAHVLARRLEFDHAMAALDILDDEDYAGERANELSWIAIGLVQVGRHSGAVSVANRALHDIDKLDDSAECIDGLLRIVTVFASTGDSRRALDVASQPTGLLGGFEGPRRDALRAAIDETLRKDLSQQPGVGILRATLIGAQWADRVAVLEAVGEGARSVAALDSGETLWRLYEAITDAEGWWQDA